MHKRAALALRVIAVLEAVAVARLLIVGHLRDGVIDELRKGGGSTMAALAKLEVYNRVSLWGHVGTTLLILGAVVLLAFGLRAGRHWAFAAAGLLLLHFLALAVGEATNVSRQPPAWLKAVWWTEGVSLALGLALPLLAVARALPIPLARLGAGGAGLIFLMDTGVSTYGLLVESSPPILRWLVRGVVLASGAWFVALAFPLAQRLARDERADLAQPAGSMDGTALRTLGWALLARILSAIALQVLLMASMASGEYEPAGAITTAGTGVSTILSIVIFFCLLRYLRFPPTHRSESVLLAMGLLVLGLGVEIYAATSASKLFDLVAQARRATSFWSMPSFSEIESLQSNLTWAGRAGVVLGIGAGLALVSSLRVTARALNASDLVTRANRAMALLVTAGVGVVVVGVATEGLKRDAGPLLLLFALALLFVAIVLLGNWLGLLFGLAKELETLSAPDHSGSTPG